jgi:hypothetical protein
VHDAVTNLYVNRRGERVVQPDDRAEREVFVGVDVRADAGRNMRGPRRRIGREDRRRRLDRLGRAGQGAGRGLGAGDLVDDETERVGQATELGPGCVRVVGPVPVDDLV